VSSAIFSRAEDEDEKSSEENHVGIGDVEFAHTQVLEISYNGI
jgi:hypothetical protein